MGMQAVKTKLVDFFKVVKRPDAVEAVCLCDSEPKLDAIVDKYSTEFDLDLIVGELEEVEGAWEDSMPVVAVDYSITERGIV